MRNPPTTPEEMMRRWPSVYIPCPECRKPKRTTSKQCMQCREKAGKSPEIKEIFYIDGSPCRKISLTQGQYAIVDEADYEWLSKFSWHAMKYSNGYYAGTKLYNPKREVKMHCMILVLNPKAFRDHRNGNSLDNRRSNLRPCTYTQNCYNRRRQRNNTSGYHGVGWNKRENNWQARIKVNKKLIYLGGFKTALEAAIVRDQAAIKYHGEFARLNFPAE